MVLAPYLVAVNIHLRKKNRPICLTTGLLYPFDKSSEQQHCPIYLTAPVFITSQIYCDPWILPVIYL
jgi:hypothetical protein